MEGKFEQKVEPFWSAATVAQACQVTSYGENLEEQWPILFKVSAMWGLQTKEQLAAMCGVIGHESAHHWWPIHEFGTKCNNCLWDPVFARYGYAPTGECYGGHGLIQTTWPGNHERAQILIQEKTGVKYDLINHPHLILNDPVLAAHCACVYWVDHAGGILQTHSANKNWGEVIHYVWGLNAPGNPDFDQYFRELKYAAEYLLAR